MRGQSSILLPFNRLYTDHQAEWAALANEARGLIRPLVVTGRPTVDDVKEVLQPLIELKDHYRAFIENNPRLTQQYWSSYFTDYVLHQVYQPTLNVDV